MISLAALCQMKGVGSSFQCVAQMVMASKGSATLEKEPLLKDQWSQSNLWEKAIDITDLLQTVVENWILHS